MKKILTLLVSLFALNIAFAQSDMVRVDVTRLSPEQLRAYQELKLIEQGRSLPIDITKVTPEAIDKYAAIGKSFGTAFKECWTTVSTDAEKFAQSDAGKMTMVLIAWKIMGNDAINLVEKSVQYAIGIPLWFAGTWFFIYIFKRNCVARPALKSSTKVWWLTIKREYEGLTKPIHAGEEMLLYGICYGIFVAICCAIVFVG